MKRTTIFVLGVVLLAAGYVAGRYGMRAEMASTPPQTPQAGERKPLYWHDPMYPQQKFDKPGKSPFMDMQLVPVYGDEKPGAESGVTVSSRAQQNLGLRSVLAEVTEIREEMPAVGTVQADERRMARAEVRTTGWVEKLHVRAVNDPVRAGQLLAEVYSPELLAAQEEYLLSRRMAQANPADEPIAQAARRKLEVLGYPAAEIRRLEQSGESRRRVPLLAPIAGVLSELGVREGAMVQAGTAAFTLTDLSSVWIIVELPEAQAAPLRPGLRVTARAQSLPGKALEGLLDYVYPELNAQTRTVKARATLSNPGLMLRPGMYVQVSLVSATRRALTIPTEAVIQTGTRGVVIVMDGERFRAATVKTGVEIAGRTEILEGLKPGERVVASGQFLIDSEASLKGALDRLAPPAETAAKGGLVPGRGVVTGVDAAKGRVEIDHEPIAEIKWPRMTMEFLVEDRVSLGKLKKGDAVEFDMRREPSKDGDYTLPVIRRAK
jgi:Cu(I)/Ag(I) efflux system membrane fusion protein